MQCRIILNYFKLKNTVSITYRKIKKYHDTIKIDSNKVRLNMLSVLSIGGEKQSTML